MKYLTLIAVAFIMLLYSCTKLEEASDKNVVSVKPKDATYAGGNGGDKMADQGVPKPTITPGTGNYTGKATIIPGAGTVVDTSLIVSITHPNTMAVIYYTTNGIDPEPTTAMKYIKPLKIFGSTVIKAKAFAPTGESEIETATIKIYQGSQAFMFPNASYVPNPLVSLDLGTNVSFNTNSRVQVPTSFIANSKQFKSNQQIPYVDFYVLDNNVDTRAGIYSLSVYKNRKPGFENDETLLGELVYKSEVINGDGRGLYVEGDKLYILISNAGAYQHKVLGQEYFFVNVREFNMKTRETKDHYIVGTKLAEKIKENETDWNWLKSQSPAYYETITNISGLGYNFINDTVYFNMSIGVHNVILFSLKLNDNAIEIIKTAYNSKEKSIFINKTYDVVTMDLAFFGASSPVYYANNIIFSLYTAQNGDQIVIHTLNLITGEVTYAKSNLSYANIQGVAFYPDFIQVTDTVECKMQLPDDVILCSLSCISRNGVQDYNCKVKDSRCEMSVTVPPGTSCTARIDNLCNMVSDGGEEIPPYCSQFTSLNISGVRIDDDEKDQFWVQGETNYIMTAPY